MSASFKVGGGRGMHVIDGVLIVPAPADFSDQAFKELKRGVLEAVHASMLRSVIIDMSRIDLLDTVMFGLLAETARTAWLLGARTVFVGFQPGVVSALIDMDVDCDDIVSARNLEDGLLLLKPVAASLEPDESSDTENDGEQDADRAEGATQGGSGLDAAS